MTKSPPAPYEEAASQPDLRPYPVPPDLPSQRLFHDDTVVVDDQGQPRPDPFPAPLLSPRSSAD